MFELRVQSVLNKALKTSDTDIKQQLEILKKIVNFLKDLDPLFNQWYINDIDVDISMDEEELENITASLKNKFPSDQAEHFLFKERKSDPTDISLLWNGGDNETYASISLSILGFQLSLHKKLSIDVLIKIYNCLLQSFPFNYLYITNDFIYETSFFEHRQTVSPFCYVSKTVNENDLPYLFKKIEVKNELNQGTILVFDENFYEESDRLSAIIEENAIVLVTLNAIPETELPSDFFSDIGY